MHDDDVTVDGLGWNEVQEILAEESTADVEIQRRP